MRKESLGYEISTSPFGYSVYLDGHCVAAGGILGGGEKANVREAKSVIKRLIAGTQKPLWIPDKRELSQ